MTVSELIDHFKEERRPYVAAAAFLGIHPRTISVWEEKGGKLPEQWAALFQVRQAERRKT